MENLRFKMTWTGWASTLVQEVHLVFVLTQAVAVSCPIGEHYTSQPGEVIAGTKRRAVIVTPQKHVISKKLAHMHILRLYKTGEVRGQLAGRPSLVEQNGYHTHNSCIIIEWKENKNHKQIHFIVNNTLEKKNYSFWTNSNFSPVGRSLQVQRLIALSWTPSSPPGQPSLPTSVSEHLEFSR